MVAKLVKTDFITVVESNPDLKAQLDKYMSYTGLNNFLRQFTVFSAMTAKELKAWLDYLDIKTYSDGEYVFHEGDEPDNFYIVVKGYAEVVKENDDAEDEVITELEEGKFFGEFTNFFIKFLPFFT